jgi:hypothetical protein
MDYKAHVLHKQVGQITEFCKICQRQCFHARRRGEKSLEAWYVA